MHHERLLLRTLAVIGLVFAATSCYRLQPLEGRRVDIVTAGDLEGLAPNDIAVAPIVNLTGDVYAVPEGELRTAFQTALLRRRYSPLSLEYVDAAVPVEAAYSAGAAREDATLFITVERWDSKQWDAHDALEVAVEVTVVDPAAPLGAELWKARAERRFDRADFGTSIDRLSEPQRIKVACEAIASDILAAMPARANAAAR